MQTLSSNVRQVLLGLRVGAVSEPKAENILTSLLDVDKLSRQVAKYCRERDLGEYLNATRKPPGNILHLLNHAASH